MSQMTLERMRADIAALIHVAPEEIGLYDDLTDLGLDSMRLMSLALAWQEAGLPLDFAVLAETQRLGDWWAALQPGAAAP